MQNVSLIENIVKQRKDELHKKQAKNDFLREEIKKKHTLMIELAEQLKIGQEGLDVVGNIANSRRGAMKTQVEGIVTEALQLVYGPDVKVELVYDVKAGRSFVDIQLVKQTPFGEVKRTMEGIGGGVSDTISVPLRLLVLLASRQTDKVCVLDEAYKHVDLERVDRVAEFVGEISHRLGIQVIMASHHEAMREAADTVHVVEEKDGKSSVTKMA